MGDFHGSLKKWFKYSYGKINGLENQVSIEEKKRKEWKMCSTDFKTMIVKICGPNNSIGRPM